MCAGRTSKVPRYLVAANPTGQDNPRPQTWYVDGLIEWCAEVASQVTQLAP
jgi:hypothetical protein